MKKLLLLLSLILTVSCSSNDENTQGAFRYPSWIEGSWKDNATGAILTFTKNDIKYNSDGNIYSFSKNQVSTFSNQKGPLQIANTSDLYIVDFGQVLDGSFIRFNFVRSSGSTMESKGHLPGSYTKQ